jgi:hypothetical protein
MCLSKLVIVAFIRTLTPKAVHLRINTVLGGITVLWTVASVFSIAFACGMPHPWNKLSGTCFNRVSSLGDVLSTETNSISSIGGMQSLRLTSLLNWA